MDLMNLIDIQVLMVNSDRDSRELYTLPLEKCGANITTVSSIQDAVRILDLYKPALILCKMGCSTESIEPLIQQISHPKQTTGNRMSLLVTSTCADTSASQELPVMINAYLSNPVAIDPIMYDVWKLIRQSESLSPLSRDAQITRKQLSLTLH
jgi:response regulator RpfG family c-di-GMP phosphodiesterase